MTLVTCCPNCGTAFRVQAAQLAQRGGRVRCGKCSTVFDGVAALNEPTGTRDPAQSEPSPQLALFEPGEPLQIRAALAGPVPASEHDFLREAPPPRGSALWLAGGAVALVALLFQVLLLYRTELSVLFPATREPFAATCRLLGCTLYLPRKPDLMSIETSDLESDRRQENVIVLNAVIRNRAPFAQEYPALELTLTDERDQAVLRRVLAPAQYLQNNPAAGPARGIAPGAETTLRLHFHTGGVRAVGYRLYLFYP
jgi:predicted Zn finger-like uncharacterized protein